MNSGKLWDIFCRVIDNHGDLGVCWRLACGLAERGERVRLWVDDGAALAWMAPHGASGVEVRNWTPILELGSIPMGGVLVETFGCGIDPPFVAACASHAIAAGVQGLWLNLEYLSAESYVERCHGLPSPLPAELVAGLRKYFFYPGFNEATGGLLRETDLLSRQARFDREAWLRDRAIDFRGEQLVSLFCYEPAALDDLLRQLAARGPTRLLVTAGRTRTAVEASLARMNRVNPTWNQGEKLLVSYLPLLTQHDFDHLLWCCDLNFVRGEDSLVRALWAGKPFVWQLYPQADKAHQAKLEAFLDMLQAPAALRSFHRVWNDVDRASLPAIDLTQWQPSVSGARTRLLVQQDLVTGMLQFALKNR